uniref:Uncharacterized protein n=1 Tax=Nelumbo nucifera TaxID=4432 RepID=A0A822XW94_NELNU|nr:TPA_asm: hypothetical protein HUJ06_024842 [Nelumbo nucifera]
MGHSGNFNRIELIRKITARTVFDTLSPADYELDLLVSAPTFPDGDGGETQTSFCDPYNHAPLPIAVLPIEVGRNSGHDVDTISYRSRTVVRGI